MTNRSQNLNIGHCNSPNISSSVYSGQVNPADNPYNSLQDTVNDMRYKEDNSPPHIRLNALDSTLLEAEAYRDIDDDIFRTEYQINRIEETLKNIDKEIENAKSINDYPKADILITRKRTLQNELELLYENYNKSDITTKISGTLTDALNVKPAFIAGAVDNCKEFVEDKLLSKISKKFNSGQAIKNALTKLETLNKNVNELVTMQTPYGEADERYDRLSDYLNSANIIHYRISKTVGTPVFTDTISSIDKEKLKKGANKNTFGNMTSRRNLQK